VQRARRCNFYEGYGNQRGIFHILFHSSVENPANDVERRLPVYRRLANRWRFAGLQADVSEAKKPELAAVVPDDKNLTTDDTNQTDLH